MPPLIEAKSVYKTYRLGRVDVPVLRGTSLAVNEGECIAVLGASGSGKSTLLHLLGGLDRCDKAIVVAKCPACSYDTRGLKGTTCPECGKPIINPHDANVVAFEGQPLNARSTRELDAYRARTVGFVFQFYHLLPELTVLQNALVAAMIGRGRFEWTRVARATRERAAELLQRFGLGDRMNHRPVELSGGERQRVAIARALINQPRLLLADEPTGNLDAATGGSILDALMQLRRENNQTMVIVTHDAATAARADRVVRLKDGVVVGEEA